MRIILLVFFTVLYSGLFAQVKNNQMETSSDSTMFLMTKPNPPLGNVREFVTASEAADTLANYMSFENIYTVDGTLTGTRALTMGGYDLTFLQSGIGDVVFYGNNAVWTNYTNSHQANIGAYNSGTFVGSESASPFEFRIGNTAQAIIESDGDAYYYNDLGIGISPAYALDVVGEFRLNNATEGIDRVLRSDANGLASWVDLGTLGGGTDDQTLQEVLTSGNDAGGLDAINFAEVEADEFIGDLRGAVLFKAQAGETLAKGDVVYVSGISGNTTIVSKADADDATKMPAFGVVAAAASLNNPVDIYTFGTLSNLNTSAFTIGDILYVSTTAGQLTATPPTGESALIQNIAKVTRVDNAAGSIKISGAGRTNATPNLNTGRLFVGNASNQAVADGTMYVDIANARVGIGTSTPSVKFEVDGGDAVIRNSANTNLKVWDDAPSGGGWVSMNANRGTNQIVGATIGVDWTTTPNLGKLESIINGDSYILHTKDYVDGTETVSLRETVLNEGGLDIDFRVESTTSTNALFVDASTNRVGIGTSSPSQKLDVRGRMYLEQSSGYGINIRSGSANSNDGANILIDDNSTMAMGVGGSIGFRGSDGNVQRSFAYIKGGKENATSLNFDGYLSFHTRQNNQADHDEAMRITSGGDVGIGLTNPLSILDIHDNDAIVNIRDNSDSSVRLRMRGNSANDIYDIRTEIIGGYTWHDRGANLITHYDDVDNYVWRSNGAVERMRLNSTGLGIGTSSPLDKLHVNGAIRVQNSSALLRRYLAGWTETTHDVVYSGFSTAGDNYNDYVYLKAPSSGGSKHGIALIGDDAFSIGYSSIEQGAITSLDGYYIFGNSTGIGIGTNSPSNKLHVKADANEPAIRVEYDGTQGNAATIRFSNGYTENWVLGVDNTYASRDFVLAEISTVAGTDNENPKYIFNGNGDGSLSITDAVGGDINVLLNTNGDSYFNGGDIGIGLTNPSQKLQVAGNIFTTNDGTTRYIRSYSSTGAWSELTGIGLRTDGAMSIYSNDDRVNSMFLGLPSAEWNNIVAYYSGSFTFVDSDATVATLNSSGLDLTTVPTENTNDILTWGSTGLVSTRSLSDIVDEINSGALNNLSESISATGWYTVAVIPYNSSGEESTARFGVRAHAGGIHQVMTFYASQLYNKGASINVISSSNYAGTATIQGIRIKSVSTYDGAVLQIYVSDTGTDPTCSIYLLGDNFESTGWKLKDWIADATDPGDVLNYGTFVTKAEIDVNEIRNGGFATSGGLIVQGETGIGTTNPSEKLEVSGGNILIDNTDAVLKLKAGVAGTNGRIAWTFNTDATEYATIGLDYDNRGSDGLLLDSAYPITIDHNTDFFTIKEGGTDYIKSRLSGSIAEMKIYGNTGGDAAIYLGDYADNVRGGLYYDTSEDALQIRGYNNSTAITVDNNLNVGIGTTTPSAKLDVSDPGDGNDILRIGTERAWIFQQRTGTSGATTELNLKSETGGGKRFNITDYLENIIWGVGASTTADGYFLGNNWGIGTSSPSSTLDIIGDIQVSDLPTDNGATKMVAWGGDGRLKSTTLYTNSRVGVIGAGADLNSMTDYSSVSSAEPDLNTPFGASWYNLINIRHRGGITDGDRYGGQIAFGMTSYRDRIAFRAHYQGTWDSWKELYHTDNITDVDVSTLDLTNYWQKSGSDLYYNSGNVGIGTSSPQSNLHVSAGTSGNAILTIEADTDNNNESDNPLIIFEQDGGLQLSSIGHNEIVGSGLDANAFQIANSVSSGGIGFLTGTSAGYTNASTRMYIAPNGGVGIGTTSPAKQLEIENTGAAATMIIQTTDDYNAYIEYQNNSGGGGLNYRTGVTTLEHFDISSDGQTMLRLDRANNRIQVINQELRVSSTGSEHVFFNTDNWGIRDQFANLVLYFDATSSNPLGTSMTTYNNDLYWVFDSSTDDYQLRTGSYDNLKYEKTTGTIGEYWELGFDELKVYSETDFFTLTKVDHAGGFPETASFEFTDGGYIRTSSGIEHKADSDTEMFFADDIIRFYAGGKDLLHLEERAGLVNRVVINQNSTACEFRVESDTDENAIFMNGTSGDIGFGTNTPSAAVDIIGDLEVNGEVTWSERAFGEGTGCTTAVSGTEDKLTFSSITTDGDISETSSVFTPTNTGKYRITLWVRGSNGGGADDFEFYAKVDNTRVVPDIYHPAFDGQTVTYSISFDIDVTGGHTIAFYGDAVGSGTFTVSNAMLQVRRIMEY